MFEVRDEFVSDPQFEYGKKELYSVMVIEKNETNPLLCAVEFFPELTGNEEKARKLAQYCCDVLNEGD